MTNETTEKKTYWMQFTTGTLHKSRNACMSRGSTRYFNGAVTLTDAEFAAAKKCRRCFVTSAATGKAVPNTVDGILKSWSDRGGAL